MDEVALERALQACERPDLKALLAGAQEPFEAAALMEDALHHDGLAWSDPRRFTLRPKLKAARPPLRLTLPLPADYRGARFADAPWT